MKTVAFPDFQAQDWPTWQRLDRRVAQFALTFEEWQAYAALRLAELANRGCDVSRVVITPEDIVPWLSLPKSPSALRCKDLRVSPVAD